MCTRASAVRGGVQRVRVALRPDVRAHSSRYLTDRTGRLRELRRMELCPGGGSARLRSIGSIYCCLCRHKKRNLFRFKMLIYRTARGPCAHWSWRTLRAAAARGPSASPRSQRATAPQTRANQQPTALTTLVPRATYQVHSLDRPLRPLHARPRPLSPHPSRPRYRFSTSQRHNIPPGGVCLSLAEAASLSESRSSHSIPAPLRT